MKLNLVSGKDMCKILEMVCKQAEQRTKNRIAAIALVTVLNGIVCRDLRPQSLVDNFVGSIKHVWKTNQDARKDAIDYALCKLFG